MLKPNLYSKFFRRRPGDGQQANHTASKPSIRRLNMKVLVTGATAGFGAAIVRRFAAGGHHIVATGRRSDRLAALAHEFGPTLIHAVVFDVRDRKAVDAAIAGLPPDFADLDLLVDNAGLPI